MKRWLAIVATISLGVFIFCTQFIVTGPEVITLTETGSTLVFPVLEAWSSRYHEMNPNVRIASAATGSGMGITQVGEGLVDIGASDAYLHREEHLERYFDLVHIPILVGDVAIAYNVPEVGNRTLRLSASVISKIWRGMITYWDDEELKALNPDVELPHEQIRVIYRADSSGTTFLFTSWLTLEDPEWENTLGYGVKVRWTVGIGADGSQSVAELTRSTKYSISYLGSAWVKENNLPSANILNPTSGIFVASTVANIKAATDSAMEAGMIPSTFTGEGPNVPLFNAPGENSYPLIGFVYFLVKNDQTKIDPERAMALKDFLLWVIDQNGGQAIVPEFDYAPLPASVSEAVREEILTAIKWPEGG
jgi:phosphate transport system substrate-binding protein